MVPNRFIARSAEGHVLGANSHSVRGTLAGWTVPGTGE